MGGACLRVEEGPENGDGCAESVDRLDGRVEDDDGGDDDGYPLHRVADAEGQRGDLVQGHVGDLVVQVVEHALSGDPPGQIHQPAEISASSGR